MGGAQRNAGLISLKMYTDLENLQLYILLLELIITLSLFLKL